MAVDGTIIATPSFVGQLNTAVPFTSGNVMWTDIDNSLSVDGTTAVAALTAGDTSYGLIYRGFDISLPQNAYIAAIRLKMTAYCPECLAATLNSYLTPSYPDFSSSDLALRLPSMGQTSAETEVEWNRDSLVGFTPAIVNNSALFGICLYRSLTAITRTINIDGIVIEVDYNSSPKPQYANDVILGTTSISTANTNRDGTGAVSALAIVSNPSTGARVNKLVFTAAGATTAGMIRVYLGDSAATPDLFREIEVPAITPSVTQAAWRGEIDLPGGLLFREYAAGTRIDTMSFSTHNAESFNVFAFGGQYD